MAEKLNRYQTYLKEGYTDEEIQNHLRPIYQKNGFSDEQINEYFKQNASVKENKVTVTEIIKDMFAPIGKVTDSVSIKPYNNNVAEDKKEVSLRARTKEDDKAQTIYEPDGFDILGEKIAVASAADKGVTNTQDLEKIKKKQNFAMMTAGVVPFVAGGQMSVGGLAILEGIQQAKNYISSKLQGKSYDFMAYENLSSLLPDNTPSVLRVTSSLAEMVGDCVIAGKLETTGVKVLLNEAVNRLENKMVKAGYNADQIKTAINNLKTKVVERVTGQTAKQAEQDIEVLKQKAQGKTVTDIAQPTQTEPKPINIDEAVKINVGIGKAKIPEAPKEPPKADIDIKEIKEPTKIENNINVEIKQKWDNAKKVEGNSDIVPVGDKSIEGKFVLVEADAPTASHNPNANFQMTKGFPVTKEGKTVNDRDYFNDKQAQAIVIDTANKYDFRAVKDMPVVSNEGIVLSGNQRTMASQISAKNGTDTNYVDYLKEHSQQYGFTKQQIEEFKHPRIVFVPNENIEYTTQNFALFNAQDKKTQNALETAVSLGKRIDDETVKEIANIFDKFETMGEFNSSPADIREVINVLANKQIINKNDLAKYTDTSSTGTLQLSEVGKDFFENLLLGTAIKEQTLRDLRFIRNVRAKLLKNLLPLLENKALPKEYQIQDDLEQAIRLMVEAQQSKAGTIANYLSQRDFLQEVNYTEEQIKLAQLLQQDYKKIKTALTSYNNQAIDNVNYGQGDLISGGKQQTKEDLLNEIFKNNKDIKNIEFVEQEGDVEPIKAKDDTVINFINLDTKTLLPQFDTIKDLREAIFKIINETGPIEVKQSNSFISFSKDGIRRGLKRGRDEKNKQFFAELKKVVENAVYAGFKNADEEHKNVLGQGIYYTAMKIGEHNFAVEIETDVAKNQKNNNYPYAGHKVKEINIKELNEKSQGIDTAIKSVYNPDNITVAHFNKIFKNNFIERPKQKTVKEDNNVSASKTDFSQQIKIQLPNVTKTHNELIRKSEIINDLAKDVDLPVRVGGTHRKHILGLYYQKEEMVRLQVANDMLTLAHEIGHHEEKVLFGGVARKYKDFTPEEKEFYKELKPLATKPLGNETRGKMFSEGMAQFISMFVNNPAQAQQVAPKFYEFFTKEAPIKTPEIYNALVKAQTRMSKYYSQNAINTVKSHISFKEEKKPFEEKFKLFKKKFLEYFVDRLSPLKESIKEFEKKTGVKLSNEDNPYYLARLVPGSIGRAEYFLEKGTYDFKTLQNTGKSLKEILKGVVTKGGTIENFASYLVAHDTLELVKRGIKTGIEPKAAQETVNLLGPIYDKYAEELYQYRLSLLKMLKDGQVISEEAFNNIVSKTKRYTPLQRVMDEEKTKLFSGKNFKSKNPIKNIKGSGRDIINPIETIIEDTYNFINLVEKNRVGLALANLATVDKAGAFVFGPIHKTKTTKDIQGNENIEQDNTIDKNNEIKVYKDGKMQIYEVDPDIARVVNGLTTENANSFIKALSFFTQVLRAGATGLNTAFAAKNLFRDTIFAEISTTTDFKPIQNIINMMKAPNEAIIDFKKNKGELFKAGGGQTTLIGFDRATRQKAIEDLTDTGYLQKIWNRISDKEFVEAIRIGLFDFPLLKLAGDISESAELITRLGEFKSSLKNKSMTKENLEQAAYNAREITLDFAKGGLTSKFLNQFVAFYNAGILGLEKTTKILKDKNQTIKAITILGSLGVLTALINYANEELKRDKDIEDVNRVQRDTNFVFKLGGIIWKIPKPQEIGFISTIFEEVTYQLLDSLNNDEKTAFFSNIASSFASNLNWDNLIPVPDVAKTIAEIWANKSIFFRRPIVSAELEKVLPEYQYTEYTTELSKFIAKTLGNIGINKGVIERTIGSPQKLEYLVNSLTGGTGKFLFQTIDKIGRMTGALPDKEYELPGKTLADIPFARAFVIRYPQSSKSIQDFYEKYNEMMKYVNSFKLSVKRADVEAINKLAIYQSIEQVSSISQNMSEVRKAILTVYTNKNMNKDEKRQTIDELMLTRITLAKQGLTMLKEIEENIKEEK